MSVKRNFTYNVAYQFLILILPLVTVPYLSRVLGAEGVGEYSYTYSIASYFVLFAMLGVNNYGNRTIAMVRDDRRKRSEVFWGIWIIQAAMCFICVVVYVLYTFFISDNIVQSLIWLPLVLTGAFDINWLFFGLENFKLTVSRNFIIKLATFILTLIVVRGENALTNYLILMSLSYFLSVAILWPFVKKEVDFVKPTLKDVVQHVKPDLVLFVPVIAISLYTVLDKVMLGILAGMGQTGIFENSLKVAQMPFAFISALGTVMLPHASNMLAKGNEELAKEHMETSMWFVLLLSSAFTFGIVAVSPEFVPAFFGSGFDECKIVLPIIVCQMPFMAWANVIRTQWLMPKEIDRAYVASVFAGAFVNIFANLILIPHFGATGAGVATLMAEIVVCVVQTVAVSKQLHLRTWFVNSVPGFLIGAVMLVGIRIIAHFLPTGLVGVVLEIAIGALIFAVLFVAWSLLTRNEKFKTMATMVFRRSVS